MTTSATTPRVRWLGRLFLALTLLYLVPIWSVRYLPTSDGPAHLYNAWVLRGLLTGSASGITTLAHRVDEIRPDLHLDLPAVHERAFRTGRIEIRDVPFNRRSRINLRLWILGSVRAREFKVRVAGGGGRVVGEKVYPIGVDAYWANGNLTRESSAPADADFVANIIIEPEAAASDARLWAFVTLMDNATEMQRVILPESGTGFGQR